MAQTIATVGLKKVPIHIPNAQNRILFKNGRIVNDDGESDADIYIEDGVIRQLGQNLIVPGGVRTIDIRGQLVFPAGIDTSTRFVHESNGLRTADTIYSGTRSAVRGGTALVFIELRRGEPSESLVAALNRMLETTTKEACCNFAVHVVIDRFDEATARDLETLVREFGVSSFQVDTAAFSDEQLHAIFKLAHSLGVLVRCPTENRRLIESQLDAAESEGLRGAAAYVRSHPEDAELATVSRAMAIATAGLSGAPCPLLVGPVSSRRVCKLVARARRNGQPVYADALSAALADGAARRGAVFSNPPVRCGVDATCRRDESLALMNQVATGDLAAVCSHHAAFDLTVQQAALADAASDVRKVPNGVAGVAERLFVLHEYGVQRGLLDRCAFVRATSANAARLFGIYPRRGRIALGSDADLFVWNPKGTTTLGASKDGATSSAEAPKADGVNAQGKSSIYEGMTFRGALSYLVANGRVVIDEGDVKVGQGWGKYERCVSHAPFVYSRLEAFASWQMAVQSNRRVSGEELPDDASNLLNVSVIELSSSTASASASGNLLRLAMPGEPVSPLPSASPTSPQSADIYRMSTRSGVRNQQESSFSLGGAQIDDTTPFRPKIRTKQQNAQNPIW